MSAVDPVANTRPFPHARGKAHGPTSPLAYFCGQNGQAPRSAGSQPFWPTARPRSAGGPKRQLCRKKFGQCPGAGPWAVSLCRRAQRHSASGGPGQRCPFGQMATRLPAPIWPLANALPKAANALKPCRRWPMGCGSLCRRAQRHSASGGPGQRQCATAGSVVASCCRKPCRR